MEILDNKYCLDEAFGFGGSKATVISYETAMSELQKLYEYGAKTLKGNAALNTISIFDSKTLLPYIFWAGKKDAHGIFQQLYSTKFNFYDVVNDSQLTDHVVSDELNKFFEDVNYFSQYYNVGFLRYGGNNYQMFCSLSDKYCLEDYILNKQPKAQISANELAEQIKTKLPEIISTIKNHPILGSCIDTIDNESNPRLFETTTATKYRTMTAMITDNRFHGLTERNFMSIDPRINSYSAYMHLKYTLAEGVLKDTALVITTLYDRNDEMYLAVSSKSNYKVNF